MAKEEPAYLADYVTVNERIALFHKANEHGAIRTRCIYDDAKTVRFVACAHRSEGPCHLAENHTDCLNAAGTGWAEEIRGAGYVNKTSALENCETSAVGRALAMAGIAVEKSVATKDEVEQAQAERERQERETGPITEAETVGAIDEARPIEAVPKDVEVLGPEGGAALVEALDKVVDRDRMRLAATHVRGFDIGDLTDDAEAAECLGRLTLDQVYRLREWAEKKAEEAKKAKAKA